MLFRSVSQSRYPSNIIMEHVGHNAIRLMSLFPHILIVYAMVLVQLDIIIFQTELVCPNAIILISILLKVQYGSALAHALLGSIFIKMVDAEVHALLLMLLGMIRLVNIAIHPVISAILNIIMLITLVRVAVLLLSLVLFGMGLE